MTSYLRGDTLTARRRTPLYVLSKRIKRQRIPLTFAGSLLTVAVILGVLPGGWVRGLFVKTPAIAPVATAAPATDAQASITPAAPASEPTVQPATTQPADTTSLAEAAALQGQAETAWNSIAKIDGGQGLAAKIEAAKATRLTAQTLFDRNAYTDAKASLQSLLASIDEIRALDAARTNANIAHRKWRGLALGIQRITANKELAAFRNSAGSLDSQAAAKYEAADFLDAETLWNRIFVELVPVQISVALEKARVAYSHKAYRDAYADLDPIVCFDGNNADARALRAELLKNDLDGSLTHAVFNPPLPEITFDKGALADSIEFLRDVSGANFLVNWNSLAAAGITAKSPVTVKLRNVPLLQALQAICDSLVARTKIGFSCARGVITISTVEDIQRTVTTIPYDISDLLCRAGKISKGEQMRNLAKCIELHVAPESWRDSGGTVGEIKELNDSLVITQMPEALAAVGQFVEERFRKSYLFYNDFKSSPASSGQPATMPATQPTNSPEFAEALATAVRLEPALNQIEKVDRSQGFAPKLDAIRASDRAAYDLFAIGAFAAANDSFKKMLPAANELLALDAARRKAIDSRAAGTAVTKAASARYGSNDSRIPWASITLTDTQAAAKFEAGEFAAAQSLWASIPARLEPMFRNVLQSVRTHVKYKDYRGAYDEACWALTIKPTDAGAKALREEVVRTDPEGFLALSEKVLPELNANGAGLSDVIDLVRTGSGCNIVVDWKTLEAAGVDRNAPMHVALLKVTADKALAAVCDSASTPNAKVVFGCDAGVVTISTPDEFYKTAKTVPYDISELLTKGKSPTQTEQVAGLIKTLTLTVAPASWLDAGGTVGAIREMNNTLIITQNAENQRAIASTLAQLAYRPPK
jgi:hypothetical protein